MRIDTTRWGAVEVPDTDIIHFPHGLYGLEHLHEFCLLKDEGGAFLWLQSVRAPNIAMILTDPFLHFPDYEVVIPEGVADTLQASDAAEVTVYTTVSIDPGGESACTNLLGPLIINYRANRGTQQVQDDRRYSARHQIGAQSS